VINIPASKSNLKQVINERKFEKQLKSGKYKVSTNQQGSEIIVKNNSRLFKPRKQRRTQDGEGFETGQNQQNGNDAQHR